MILACILLPVLFVVVFVVGFAFGMGFSPEEIETMRRKPLTTPIISEPIYKFESKTVTKKTRKTKSVK